MQVELDETKIPDVSGSTIAIIQSKWYAEQTDRMIERCAKLLRGAGAKLVLYRVSGALELPLASQTLARSDQRPDAIICFGAIMKGETYHFEMIVDECTRGLGTVMLTEGLPVLLEVIPITDIKQLDARSADDAFNKGIEAALAAAETVHWLKNFESLGQEL